MACVCAQSLGTGLVPPPPPLEDAEDVCSDKEALYSMLISWYMSGYHTGYYQVSLVFPATRVSKKHYKVIRDF